MLVCYARTLYTVTYNPGVVPLEPKLGLESFYTRDFYTCRSDGLPIWCSDCQNWKPDRAHHSGDIQRCVQKMDHYCPWAGGMIGETGKHFCTFETGVFRVVVMLWIIHMGNMSSRLGHCFDVVIQGQCLSSRVFHLRMLTDLFYSLQILYTICHIHRLLLYNLLICRSTCHQNACERRQGYFGPSDRPDSLFSFLWPVFIHHGRHVTRLCPK